MKLGERLAAIAAMVPDNSRLADIGTDHAYLPMFLLNRKTITAAVAGELNRGPYRMAQETIKQAGLEGQITLRLGNGLSVIAPLEVDVAVIAGMGGGTIADILTEAPAVVDALSQIIVQPMNAAAVVRHWFVEHDWTIYDEALVKDDGRLYEIIAARPGISDSFAPILYEIGPVLWCKRPPLLREHIGNLIAQSKRVLLAMGISDQARGTEKYGRYNLKIKELELRLACL
ncbi:SAM-dependent methyltransferase|uniref:tRNA (Adenine22-N1)-methyltransferase n=1 Tax=Dendrosporobacter quercicolus TaxID=146817 RepID=A0A1G9MPJ9_9FIRM|nr:class I SAM-dependent methyltransferase [Dendrosporobacter quercicolus]NSL47097.1 SAM-dependent methyltransferase [Dendrosporobacter quercicolus DSM 1736]SDL76013.1 tRNA (adenine22-N1)-methyltransferase [Dendrosporobacter quercicolus]